MLLERSGRWPVKRTLQKASISGTGWDLSRAQLEHLGPGCYLPGLRHLPHQLLTDPEGFYASLARVVPVRHLHIHSPEHLFYQWSGVLDIGYTAVLSLSSSDVSFAIQDATDIHLVASFAGQRHIDTALGKSTCAAGGLALVPQGNRQISGSFSGSVMSLKPERIAYVAAAMAGRPPGSVEVEPRFRQFPPITCSQGLQAQLVQSLLQSMDVAAALNPRLPAQLGYDDSLHRFAATLLQPALLHEQPSDLQRWRERDGRRDFDELLDFIRAHLDQPLRLSDLEARSHYSSRSLQYAFRERLGSTPKQWIRQQRLQRALEQLQDPDRTTSIRQVAWACAYRNMGLFGSDFKRKFGCTPSQARRGC